MRRVLGEATLALPRPFAVGDVVDGQDRMPHPRRRTPHDPEGPVGGVDEAADGLRRRAVKAFYQRPQREVGPRVGQGVTALRRTVEKPLGGGIRVLDYEVAIDQDDPLGKLLEDGARTWLGERYFPGPGLSGRHRSHLPSNTCPQTMLARCAPSTQKALQHLGVRRRLGDDAVLLVLHRLWKRRRRRWGGRFGRRWSERRR